MSIDNKNVQLPSRRKFLRQGLSGLAGLSLGGGMLSLIGCERGTSDPSGNGSLETVKSTSRTGPIREIHLTASVGEVEVEPGQTYRTWLYNGQFPGPEIRVKEGERLRITVENDLPDAGTTVHWHGLPVPNPMDGVPGVTQEPIQPGESMTYEYEAAPAGSYMYHSHEALQLDRGLVGPLIIEERTSHVDYDREHTVILDDFLPGPPKPLEAIASSRTDEEGSGMMGGMMNRNGGGGCPMMGEGNDRGGGMMGGGMGGIVPPYEGLLINGKLPSDPVMFEVKQRERMRLRLVNLSSALPYHVALAGHRLHVTHADGQPVEPVEVDSLVIGMGERYDVIVEATNSGAHALVAQPIEGDVPPARAVVSYQDSRRSQPPEGQVPKGLRGEGRRLQYNDLQSVASLPRGGEPDRTFNLRLSGGMMMSRGEWTIDGQQYPNADPLEIREGERVRVNLSNMSMMLHPMHLHGHFFQVGNIFKDTVLMEPHMGEASFEFVADNPGDWFFHCHNLYHMEAGMARVFTYT